MKKLTLALVLLISSLAYGETLFSRESNKLVIDGSSKEDLEVTVNALSSLSTRFSGKTISSECQGSRCDINFSQLPSFFDITFQEAPEEVYCYNAPLAFYGVANPLTVSTLEEFSSFISENCHRTRNPKAGDIGAVFNQFIDFRFRHAFIYISDKVFYEKANSGSHPYKFVRLEESLQPYFGIWEEVNNEWILKGIDRSCINPADDSSCEDGVYYYSCPLRR